MTWSIVLVLLACSGSEAPAPSPEGPAVEAPAKTPKGKAKSKGRTKAPAPAPVEMVPATVYLYDAAAMKEGREPVFVPVERQVGAKAPEKNAVWNVFKGPTEEEAAKGLSVLTSGASGFEAFTLVDGVATLKLKGGCQAEGGVHTVYDHLAKTLLGFDSVKHVKVLGPSDTSAPEGAVDHRPDCLQP